MIYYRLIMNIYKIKMIQNIYKVKIIISMKIKIIFKITFYQKKKILIII